MCTCNTVESVFVLIVLGQSLTGHLSVMPTGLSCLLHIYVQLQHNSC